MTNIIVLMAAFNGEKYIADQLKSILCQSIKPSKVIINIDKSNDKTLSIVKEFQTRFPNIKILSSNQKFGSAASNFIYILSNLRGIKFDYIALADQDDIWKVDKLEIAINKLKEGYDGYSSNVEAFWLNKQNKVLLKNQSQKHYDYFFESAGPGCTYVFSKKVFFLIKYHLNKNFFNQINNYHDWLIYALARSNKLEWFIDSYPSLYYRQHASNVFGANVGFKAFIIRVKKVIRGEGFNFAFDLIRELGQDNSFTKSLLPLKRISLLRLALNAVSCRRRTQDQIYFFVACILLAIIFPKKLKSHSQ